MNKTTRNRITEIVKALDTITILEDLAAEVLDMQQEEQEKFDNMSEGLQQSERGQQISNAAERLQEAADKIQEAFDAIEEAKSNLDQSTE